MFSPTTPVTGAAQTGFISPTYTIVQDQAPDNNAKQFAVTALGGTQAGVTTHSRSSPFTGTLFIPKTYKLLGQPNPVTGRVRDFPRNPYKLIVRKGVTPLAGQPVQPFNITVSMDLPAGADLADPANVRAALSFAFGLAFATATGLGDTLVQGTM